VVVEIETQVGTKVPGVAVVGVGPGGVEVSEGPGLADLATGTEMAPEIICNWCSMTKLVTATIAVHLAGDGMLDLDAPIFHYYPPFSMTRPGSLSRAATVRHLSSHVRGLPTRCRCAGCTRRRIRAPTAAGS
jgi:CubicO group peptidase (beta-lactamase class C family)